MGQLMGSREPTQAPAGTVLGVWAHPDDEAFLAAGALADAARRGCRVVSVYATRGEHGNDATPDGGVRSLGEVRGRELRAALAALGVDEHLCLGYPDGGLAGVPSSIGVAHVLAILDELQPDTILTFGSDGFTGHPDHRTVSDWVTAAVARWERRGAAVAATDTDGIAASAGAPSTTVLQTAVSQAWVTRFAPALGEFAAFWPGYPVATPAADLERCWQLEGALLDRKIAALRAHRSQTAHLFAVLGEPFMRAMAATEWFRRPDPEPAAVAAAELVAYPGA